MSIHYSKKVGVRCSGKTLCGKTVTDEQRRKGEVVLTFQIGRTTCPKCLQKWHKEG